MPVIKRYPNRKLYDTEAKRYVTLGDIAALIRSGEEVVVVDHTTEEDLTAVILTQIILEQEKLKKGFLPKAVLTNLVRAGGDTVTTLRRGLMLPLDLWRQVDEEIERRVQFLITRGELAKEDGQGLREKLLSPTWRSVSGADSRQDFSNSEQLLAEHGVPTKEELDHLYSQIEELSQKLDGLIQQAEAQNGAS